MIQFSCCMLWFSGLCGIDVSSAYLLVLLFLFLLFFIVIEIPVFLSSISTLCTNGPYLIFNRILFCLGKKKRTLLIQMATEFASIRSPTHMS
jgi:hypothetical protein